MRNRVGNVLISVLILLFSFQACIRKESPERNLDLIFLDSSASFYYGKNMNYMSGLLYSVLWNRMPENALYAYRTGTSQALISNSDTNGLYFLARSVGLKYEPAENPWYSMAYIYYEVEDFMRCKYCCTQAIKHNDTVVTFYVLRARCSWRFGLNEEACKDISEVEKLMMKKYVPPYPILCRN